MTAARNTVGCPECAWGKVAGCWRCGSRNAARATLGALAFAALIFGAIRCTGEPTEAVAMQDVAAEVGAMAVEAAQIAADAELTVRQACARLHGDRAQVLRVAGEGHLVCRRRGEVL